MMTFRNQEKNQYVTIYWWNGSPFNGLGIVWNGSNVIRCQREKYLMGYCLEGLIIIILSCRENIDSPFHLIHLMLFCLRQFAYYDCSPTASPHTTVHLPYQTKPTNPKHVPLPTGLERGEHALGGGGIGVSGKVRLAVIRRNTKQSNRLSWIICRRSIL